MRGLEKKIEELIRLDTSSNLYEDILRSVIEIRDTKVQKSEREWKVEIKTEGKIHH